MAGFPGGAGDLGSYMGGGGDNETSSQSTTAGNGQAILLLFVACIACTALLSIRFSIDGAGGKSSNKRMVFENATGSKKSKKLNHDDSDSSSVNSSNSKTKRRKHYYANYYDTDEQSEESTSSYNSLEDLDLDQLAETLEGTKYWVKIGDDDLILKVLENKTFENSIEDDFDAEVAKVGDLNNGHAEYSVNINMKEKVENGQLYILGITTYDIDGTETQHEVPNTNSKMFSIVASKKLREVKIKTYTGKVVSVSGDIKIGNIVKQNIQREYLLFDVSSKNGIKRVELVDSNNVVKACYDFSGDDNHFMVENKAGVTKIRLTDKNGFVEEKAI